MKTTTSTATVTLEKNITGKKILMVIAPKNFRDEEFAEPKEIFEKSGAKVTVASKGVSEANAMFGSKAKVDIDISKVNPADYDAIVFTGGTGASVYFNDPTALKIATDANMNGKLIGAICIAPSILANAGLLVDKKATSWPSEKKNIEEHGGIYTGDLVERDGNIITGKGPMAAKQFGNEIVNALR